MFKWITNLFAPKNSINLTLGEIHIIYNDIPDGNGVTQLNILHPKFHYCRTEYRDRPNFKIKANIQENFHIRK